VLALLAGLIVAGDGPWRASAPDPGTTPSRPLLDGAPADVDRIEIGRHDGPVVLAREAGVWRVAAGLPAPWPARHEQVDRLTDWLHALADARVVSRNPTRRGEFKVDDAGLAVTLSARGRPVGRLVVGDPGPELFSTYVRRADGDEVVLADGAVRPLLDRPAAAWRDLALFPLQEADIVSIDLAGAGSPARLTRRDGKWSAGAPLPGGVPAESLAARIMVLAASALAGERPAGQPAPLLTITVAASPGTTVARILPGRDPEGRYRAAVSGHDETFLLPATPVEELLALLAPPGSSAP
jgi:hypothetical protein